MKLARIFSEGHLLVDKWKVNRNTTAEFKEKGCLPIHIACSNVGYSGAVRTLLEAYPNAAKVFIENRGLPLHTASSSEPS